MSLPETLVFVDDADWRYRLHLLALSGGTVEIQPGYRRVEERLRPRVPKPTPGWDSVDAALVAPTASEVDRAWFATRDAAEAPERERITATHVASADASCWLSLPPTVEIRPRLLVSSTLRPIPALAPTARAIGLGHDTPLCLAWLAAVSLDSYKAITEELPGLAPELRRFAALMLGAQTHALNLPDPALDTLLTTIVATLIPPQHRGAETAALLEGCRAAGLLPEHPGEFERMVHGISRRRADRIHRAWLRASFAMPPTGQRET